MGQLTDAHGRGVFASRPAAGHAGREYYSTDTSVTYRDNGASWDAQATAGYTPGGTDVAVADGGTAASNAAGARTNLGLVIGTDVQGWSDIDKVVLQLTNKSGGSVAAGDVVVIDTTNDSAFTTTTTGQAEISIGIAQATIANNGTGSVLVAGLATLVNVPSSMTRGRFLETHTVVKQATGSATRRAGSFGQFLTGGTTPSAWLWGQTDQTAAGGGGGLAQSFVGYNTVGATWTATVANREWAKPITLAATSHFRSVDVHVRPNVDSTGGGFRVGLLTDIAGVPGLLIAEGTLLGNQLFSGATSGFPGTGRWISIAIGATVAAGNYWIVWDFSGVVLDIANDTSGGGDVRWDLGFDGFSGAHTSLTQTTTAIRHSVRASILS